MLLMKGGRDRAPTNPEARMRHIAVWEYGRWVSWQTFVKNILETLGLQNQGKWAGSNVLQLAVHFSNDADQASIIRTIMTYASVAV